MKYKFSKSLCARVRLSTGRFVPRRFNFRTLSQHERPSPFRHCHRCRQTSEHRRKSMRAFICISSRAENNLHTNLIGSVSAMLTTFGRSSSFHIVRSSARPLAHSAHANCIHHLKMQLDWRPRRVCLCSLLFTNFCSVPSGKIELTFV